MLDKRYWAMSLTMLLLGLVSVLMIAACGGADQQETSTQTQTPSSQAAAAPSPTQSSTARVTAVPAAQSSLDLSGSIEQIISQLKYAPFELQGIKYGGTLTQSVSSMVAHLDPVGNVALFPSSTHMVLEKVIGWLPNESDLHIHLAPVLAESWKSSSDLKTYTYTLRKGVKWQKIPPVNGRELTADDVVYSLNRYKTSPIHVAAYSSVESIEATDRYTVVIKLKNPTAWANNDLQGGFEYIVPRELVEEEGGNIKLKIIGTGPYIIKSYIPRQGLEMVRNPDYWGKDANGNRLPYTDGWKQVYITDSATVLAALRTGQLDYGSPGSIESLVSLLKSNQSMRAFLTGETKGFALAFNTKKAPWGDVRVRRAFNMALDKLQYSQSLYPVKDLFWPGPVAWKDVSDKPLAFDDYGPYYKYNPEESKRLRIEAGFTDSKIKVPTPLVYINTGASPAQAQAIQQLWKDEGISLDLLGMDLTAFSPYHLGRKNEDVGLTYTQADTSLNWFAQNKFREESMFNLSWVRDSEMARLAEEVRITTDPARLRQIARAFWDFDTLGSWNIWLPITWGYTAAQPRVRNLTLRNLGANNVGTALYPWLADALRTVP